MDFTLEQKHVWNRELIQPFYAPTFVCAHIHTQFKLRYKLRKEAEEGEARHRRGATIALQPPKGLWDLSLGTCCSFYLWVASALLLVPHVDFSCLISFHECLPELGAKGAEKVQTAPENSHQRPPERSCPFPTAFGVDFSPQNMLMARF